MRLRALLALLLAAFGSTNAMAQPLSASPSYFLRELDVMDAEGLARTRRVCARGLMPEMKRRVEADREAGGVMPPVEIYCLRIVTLSGERSALFDLYINLALQAQGYTQLHFAEQQQLLQNNEAWRTTEAILRAANAGQTTYTDIMGRPQELPCPLALDAGYTWATHRPNAAMPVSLTPAQAEIAARQCYDPGVTSIRLGESDFPAPKAGLIVGAWLARANRE